MDFDEAINEHLSKMFINGLSPQERYNKNKSNQRKKYQKKKNESILEKEMVNFIEAMATVTINKAINDIFKDWKK